MSINGWDVWTEFDFGSGASLVYSHTILQPRGWNRELVLSTSFSNWLGISSQFCWDLIDVSAAPKVAKQVCELCAYFINALPEMLGDAPTIGDTSTHEPQFYAEEDALRFDGFIIHEGNRRVPVQHEQAVARSLLAQLKQASRCEPPSSPEIAGGVIRFTRGRSLAFALHRENVAVIDSKEYAKVDPEFLAVVGGGDGQ